MIRQRWYIDIKEYCSNLKRGRVLGSNILSTVTLL